MAVRAESFVGLSTIPATPSALHATGVELPQPLMMKRVGTWESPATTPRAKVVWITKPSPLSVMIEKAEGPDAEDDFPTVGNIAPSRVWREALDSFDDVDISGMMRSRAVVMKTPPHFLRGAFRSVFRFALQEANAATGHPERTHTWSGHIGNQIVYSTLSRQEESDCLNHIWSEIKEILKLLNVACCDGYSTPFL